MSPNNNHYKILLYYHFSSINDPEEFKNQHKAFCQVHNLKGRILVSKHGINGTCAGTEEDINAYKQFVHAIPGFEKTWFKEHDIDHIPFPKLKVQHKPELVALKNPLDVDTETNAKHIEPQEFNRFYQEESDNIVVLDVRNKIESDVGKFKNAIPLNTDHFRETQETLKKLKPQLKNKKVLMYCTGGIRCEIASHLLQDEGITDIYQLNGGIYNYCKEYPDGLFEGTCYVFDDRITVAFNEHGQALHADHIPENKIITYCKFCDKKSARVINDERDGRREQIVCCKDCDEKYKISIQSNGPLKERPMCTLS